ncbi:MAG: hypothetical protein MR016_03855 [Agathobacter sp.]|nr:hypothetical protein [Agathobacter sp.]
MDAKECVGATKCKGMHKRLKQQKWGIRIFPGTVLYRVTGSEYVHTTTFGSDKRNLTLV